MPGRPTVLAYSRARGLLCLQQVRVGWVVFVCFFHLVYPNFPFLMPHLLGDEYLLHSLLNVHTNLQNAQKLILK